MTDQWHAAALPVARVGTLYHSAEGQQHHVNTAAMTHQQVGWEVVALVMEEVG